jgi:tRNA modification GTPase
VSPPDGEPATFAAVLTPAGSGAIATLAVEGPRAWDVARQMFQPRAGGAGGLPAEPPPDRFWLGRFGESPEAVDEVVVAVPRLRPVPRVEVHCHGGVEVVRWLLELLAARGVQVCTWRELERRTAADALQALAAAALAEALTARTAAVLLDQWHGALARALDAVRDALDQGDTTQGGRLLGELARNAGVGRHLTEPWRVAVLGAPNVGKSSLVNALAGYQRAIVAPTPGTTRDVVTTLTAAGGWPVELADTAGLREGPDALEGEGIAQARAAGRAADLVLWVLDAAAPPVWPEPGLGPVRLVVNKTDLPAAWDPREAAEAARVSARTGAGVAELVEALAVWLVPDAPAPGAAVPFTPELAAGVEEAARHLDGGRVAEALRVAAALRPDGLHD